jgi:hypothetical protein
MTVVMPGVCRHCGCTESNACTLANGDGCSWTDRERRVCSNPACIRAEAARLARIREDLAARDRRPNSADIHRLIAGRGRKRRKGRAA